MHSGIKASEELSKQFNTLLSTPSAFALVATVSGEAITPVALLSSNADSFEGNLAQLSPYLQPKEAVYALLRRHDDRPHLVAVTYVPDSAPVRQKMLFASTRLALVRDLGTEHFRRNIFATTPQELTPQGFERMDAHDALEAPLTEEERNLGDVKRAEMEAGQGSAKREIHLSSHMAMPVAENVLAEFKGLAGGGGGRDVVAMKINAETEVIELVPSPTGTPQNITELVRGISATEPRFTLFRYVHTHQGVQQSPILFIYTNPATPGTKAIKHRMLYPLMRRAVIEVAAREGVEIAKKFEVEDPSELTEDEVLAELHPAATAKTGFGRPKRPGR